MAQYNEIVGTQTGVTSAWIGASEDISTLYNGLTIMYTVPKDCEAGVDVTLNLALGESATSTGATPVYYCLTKRLTSDDVSANTKVMLTYCQTSIDNVQYTGWWLIPTSTASASADLSEYYTKTEIDDLVVDLINDDTEY